MTSHKRVFAFAVLGIMVMLLFLSCATLQEITAAFANLKRLQFKIGQVHGFRLAGIDISNRSRLSDFTAMDGVRLFQAFMTKRIPAEFVIDVLAINPNDGMGGSPRTVSTLTSLESRLLIDGSPTVSGNIDRAIDIPGTGQESTIPIRWAIDLFEFFGNKGYESIINLALSLGGANRNISRLAIDALPRVTTPFGEIAYPDRITIVDREFR